MELEFDKEIDALMRKGLTGRVSTGEVFNAHFDADELSAFAENAMPAPSRQLYMAHLADCDRCRRILSNLIVLNSEAGIEMPAVAAPAVSAAVQPWYRKLFLFPNLAYVMGGLVLVFGGLLGVSLLQSSMSGDSATVSQATETQPSAHGPMALDEPDYSSAANASSNATPMNANSSVSSSAVSNTAANATGSGQMPAPKPADAEIDSRNEPSAGVMLDGVDAAKPAAAAPPPSVSATREILTEREPKDADDVKKEDKLSSVTGRSVNELPAEAKKRVADENLLKQAPRSQAGGPMKSKSGPTRDAQQNFPNRADNTYELRSRRISGKDFQFKNGAWYDGAYRGQATRNVRRQTEEYKKLDSGLRVIAESLSGVVVVVWKDGAYRIQ
jgi:hypothetical protein